MWIILVVSSLYMYILYIKYKIVKKFRKGNCKLLFGIHIIKREWSDVTSVSSGTTKFLLNHFIASCSASVLETKKNKKNVKIKKKKKLQLRDVNHCSGDRNHLNHEQHIWRGAGVISWMLVIVLERHRR